MALTTTEFTYHCYDCSTVTLGVPVCPKSETQLRSQSLCKPAYATERLGCRGLSTVEAPSSDTRHCRVHVPAVVKLGPRHSVVSNLPPSWVTERIELVPRIFREDGRAGIRVPLVNSVRRGGPSTVDLDSQAGHGYQRMVRRRRRRRRRPGRYRKANGVAQNVSGLGTCRDEV